MASHPAKVKPELLATGPSQVWSWDITKLRGPAKGIWFHLYALIDIYSRYSPVYLVCLVCAAEDSVIAANLIDGAFARNGVATPNRCVTRAFFSATVVHLDAASRGGGWMISSESASVRRDSKMSNQGDTSEHGSFVRVLGRWDVFAVAFGAMIGFGWIVLTGGFLEDAGTFGAVLAFAIGGVIMGLVGLTYAELVSAMPSAGGEHNYVLRGLGSRAAFVTSWSLVFGYVSVVAFEAVALPQTLLYLAPDMLVGRLWTVAGYDVYASWAAVGIAGAVAITGLNYVGVRPAAVFQGLAVLFLLAVGGLLLLGSVVGGSADNLQPLFSGGFGGIVAVLVAVPFLFVGFDVIPQSAEEINLPFKQIGKLVVASVGAAAVFYMVVMLTVGSALPKAVLADSELPAADGMAALWGSQTFGNILVIGGVAGILTSWNAFLLGASRLLYAMAVSGMVPRWFATVHPRYRTPSNAVLFIGALSMLAPMFGEQMLVWLVDAGGISIVVAFFLVAVTFLVLRNREPDMERPFRVSGGRLVGVLAGALSLALAVLYLPGMPAALIWPYEWIILGAWWLGGIILVLRLPKVGPGRHAEEKLIAATHASRARR